MPRTIEDYADAVPLGRINLHPTRRVPDQVDIISVETRGSRIVATMRWDEYSHTLIYALDPDDVMIMGGNVAKEDTALATWAEESLIEFVYAAQLSLTESRRIARDEGIEILDHEPLDERFVVRHLLPSDWPERWAEASRYSKPIIPPPDVDRWRADGSLIAWHFVTLEHNHVLPTFGHAATRWKADGIASLDLLVLNPGLPATFGLLTVAAAIHRAAAHGAHTIECRIDLPNLHLLGFQQIGGVMQVDSRFLDIDYPALERFVESTAGWTPPPDIQQAMTAADNATYYAG